jgi:addiction module HigA family antidote
MSTRQIIPVHPGEVLAEDVLAELGMSAKQLAAELGIPANRITEIIRGRRGITADTALRLGRWLGGPAQFWLDLQTRYDLETAQLANGQEIEKTVTPRQAA